MTTCRNLIEGALRKISVLGVGSSLSSEEAEDARVLLNAMLATLSIQGGLVFTENKEVFSLTSANVYTIGSGGDFDTVRPIRIESAYITVGNTDYPLLQMLDNTQYSNITDKETTNIPESYYYDAGYPLANLYLHPTPSSAYTITLNTTKQLSSFADLDTVFSMPAEYEAMIIYNLAEWIAPEYEREASQTVKMVASSTRNTVFIQNRSNENYQSIIDAPMGDKNYFNIYRGC